MSEKWISKAVEHKGSLHRMLGVPEGQKIPGKKMAEAMHSDNALERKRANLAHTLGTFKK